MAGPKNTNTPKHASKPSKPIIIDGNASVVNPSVVKANNEKPTANAEPVGFSPDQAPKNEQSSASASKAGSDSKAVSGQSSGPKADTKPVAKSSGSAGGFMKGGIAGAVTGGLVALGLSYGGLIGGVQNNSGDNATADPAIAELQSQIAALQEQIKSVEAPQATSGASTDITGIEGTISTLQSQSDALSSRIDAIAGDIAALSPNGAANGEPNPMLTTLSDRIAALETAPQAVEQADTAMQTVITDLQTKLDASVAQSDDDLAELKAELASAQAALAETQSNLASTQSRIDEMAGAVSNATQETGLASIVAATALKSAIDRGGAFTDELETFALMGAAPQSVEALRLYAGSGVTTIEQLSAQYDDAAYAMLAATNPAQADGSMFDRLMSSAQSLVKVRPVGEIAGEGPGAAIARMGVALERNDLSAVLNEYDALPEAAKAAGADFAANVRARLEANTLITAAFSAIAPDANNAEGAK